ncbi:MAG: hypothetical protein PHN92_04935 [Geobacter sp.]|nr:hypothetical protein [Geobacter sp.]
MSQFQLEIPVLLSANRSSLSDIILGYGGDLGQYTVDMAAEEMLYEEESYWAEQ